MVLAQAGSDIVLKVRGNEEPREQGSNLNSSSHFQLPNGYLHLAVCQSLQLKPLPCPYDVIHMARSQLRKTVHENMEEPALAFYLHIFLKISLTKKFFREVPP